MATLNIVTQTGKMIAANATVGHSVMEIIRDNGVDELIAMCGGCLSCATCHVYVGTGFDELALPSSDEEEFLLESSGLRQERSRLSCQITFANSMDGLTVVIAPDS